MIFKGSIIVTVFKDEILKWLARYDKEEDLYNTGLESGLRVKFQRNRFITKEDLKKIIEWKFQGRLKGRQKRILNLLNPVNDKLVQSVSKLAFKTEDDTIKLKLFCSIRGVGPALSSVILTFFNPNKYGVFDIHVWRELFGKEPRDLFTNHNHIFKFFVKIREIAAKTGLTCREIEKALFKKNLEESKH